MEGIEDWSTKPLQVRRGFSVQSNNIITGFCVDVFIAALSLFLYAVPYELVAFGNGHEKCFYTSFTHVYDAGVGDIIIIKEITKMADFTQPYVESRLVVVAPVRKLGSNAMAFLRLFTAQIWLGAASSFYESIFRVLHKEKERERRGRKREKTIEREKMRDVREEKEEEEKGF